MNKTKSCLLRRFMVALRVVNKQGYTKGIQVVIEAVNSQQASNTACIQMKESGYLETRIVRVFDAGMSN